MTPLQDENEIEDFGVESFEEVYNRHVKSQRPQTSPIKKESSIEERGFFQPKETQSDENETIGEGIKRHGLRTSARIGETLGGLFGDVRDVSKMAGGWIVDRLRGIIGKDPLTEKQQEEWSESIKPSRFDLVGKIVESLPTSENIRENITRKYTGDYLEPQNEWEKFSDNVASDFASLAIPIKGKIPFVRSIGQAVIANAGGEVAKEFGGDKAEAYTKMGLLFSMGLLGGGKKGGVKKYINNLYNEMESTIPKGAQINASNLNNELSKIQSVLKKGDPGASSKQPAFKKIEAIRSKIKSGQIDVDDLIQFNKDLNESIFELGELRRGEHQLYNIREIVHKNIGEYGKQNPDFLKKWKNANEAYAATETSRKVGDWVRKNISLKDYAYAASALGLEGYALGLPMTVGTLATGGALAATAYTAEIMKRMAKSPALRKYYTNVVTNSLNENKGGLTRSIKQLDNALKEDFEKTPFETIEFMEEDKQK